MRTDALAYGEELDKLLKPQGYRIHSVYAGGLNLDLGDRLCYISGGRPMPYGILIDKGAATQLTACLSPGDVLVWDAEGRSLVSPQVRIDFVKARTYSSKLSPLMKKPDVTKLLPLLSGCRENGFRLTPAEMIKGEETKALLAALGSDDCEKTTAALKSWVGRGPGLTPSGDDVIQGLLFVHCLWPFITETFQRELVQLIEKDYTTTVSNHFYRCSLEGCFSQSLHHLAEGFAQEDVAEITGGVVELEGFGHTSGADILTGIVLGLHRLGAGG